MGPSPRQADGLGELLPCLQHSKVSCGPQGWQKEVKVLGLGQESPAFLLWRPRMRDEGADLVSNRRRGVQGKGTAAKGMWARAESGLPSAGPRVPTEAKATQAGSHHHLPRLRPATSHCQSPAPLCGGVSWGHQGPLSDHPSDSFKPLPHILGLQPGRAQ